MRGAKWLAAVLCPLALLVARLWAFRLHPGQGKRAATKAAGGPWGCGGAGGGVGGGNRAGRRRGAFCGESGAAPRGECHPSASVLPGDAESRALPYRDLSEAAVLL